MANKYISHGNTYDGDGTTSAAATSAGAVGAWNDLHAIWTAAPTYGTLTDGDAVFIRTSISSVDISITISATWTMLARGSVDSPVTWVADNGTVWAGETGTLKIISNAYNCTFTMRNYNNLVGDNLNWEFFANLTSNTDMNFMQFYVQVVRGIKFYCSTSTANNYVYFRAHGRYFRAENCHFGIHRSETSRYPFWIGDYSIIEYIGCEFDVTGARSNLSLFYANNYHGGMARILGGKVTGSVSTQRMCTHYTSLTPTRLIMEGFDPGNLQFDYTFARDSRCHHKVECTLIPSEKYGFTMESAFGLSEWHDGDGYPYIASELPDGTMWSIRVLPHNTKLFNIYRSPSISAYYTGAAATKTITLELLVNNDYGTIKKDQWYMDVSYEDSGGEGRLETTKDFMPSANAGNVTTSTAAWNTTTYNSDTYSKFKLVLTTANNVQQNTNIIVHVRCEDVKTDDGSYFFIDPEFGVA